mmetsp:Transcript_8400/g.15554  ORF Transcript_8400/g.15554 Transcript_8400/m.15554 type:complete len:141 (+) Transcript_8400:28-450(+)
MEKKTTTAAVELAASHSDRARVSMDMEAVGVSQSNRRVQEGEGDDGTSPQQHANMVGGMAPKVLVDIATELFGDEKREEEEEEEKEEEEVERTARFCALSNFFLSRVCSLLVSPLSVSIFFFLLFCLLLLLVITNMFCYD